MRSVVEKYTKCCRNSQEGLWGCWARQRADPIHIGRQIYLWACKSQAKQTQIKLNWIELAQSPKPMASAWGRQGLEGREGRGRSFRFWGEHRAATSSSAAPIHWLMFALGLELNCFFFFFCITLTNWFRSCCRHQVNAIYKRYPNWNQQNYLLRAYSK